MQVCRAIVNDDAEKLDGLLQRMEYGTRQHKVYRKSKSAVNSVTCNGQELLTFADEIGASDVSSYLHGGSVTIEELAGTAK